MPDPIDEIIDGLPRKNGGRRSVAEPTATQQQGSAADDGHRCIRRRWPWMTLGAAMCAPWAVAFGNATVTAKPPSPRPTITVTRIVERPVQHEVYPQSCTDAMSLIRKQLPDQAAIVSAANPQLDILSDAYTAIMLKDYTKIQQVNQRQRDLQSKLAVNTNNILTERDKVEQLIGQCEKDLQ